MGALTEENWQFDQFDDGSTLSKLLPFVHIVFVDCFI
jgi:hypothetical protein